MSTTDPARAEVERIRALLATADPPVVPDEDDAVTARDERILARITAGESRPIRVRTPRRVTWTRPAARVAVAVVAVVAVVVGGIAWQGARQPAQARTPALLHFSDADVATVLAGGGQPAHDALVALSATAASQPPSVGEGYQQIASYSWYLASTDEDTMLVPERETMLVGPDGSAVHGEVRGQPLDVAGRVVDGAQPPGGHESTDRLPAGTLDPRRARQLPRDPVALRQALLDTEQGLGCDASRRATAECLVRAVKDLAAFAVVPPDLDAALWTVLAGEPDVVRLGATTDRLGRPGVAVAVRTNAGEPHGALVLVASPDDGRLLEWDEIAASVPDLGIATPAVSGFQAFVSSEWVATPG